MRKVQAGTWDEKAPPAWAIYIGKCPECRSEWSAPGGTWYKVSIYACCSFQSGKRKEKSALCEGLRTKAAEEVEPVLRSILGVLNSILGEQVVVRLHSDAGKEFVNHSMESVL